MSGTVQLIADRSFPPTAGSTPSTRSLASALPEPQYLTLEGKCVIEYIDTASIGTASTPSLICIVLVHGAPGTYKDFRRLVPLLQDSARVVAINLPGVGGSRVLDQDKYFDSVGALGAARLAYEALAQICQGEESVFVAGHSFGGHTAINLATLDAAHRRLNVRGIILMASAGHRPHRAFWPIGSAVVANTVRADLPMISSAAKTVAKLGYTKVVGFPGNAPRSYYVSSIIRSYCTDFNLIRQQTKQLAAQSVPAFIAWAKDDVFIEEVIAKKLSRDCHAGPRIVFEKGGHNIQKTQAHVLAKEIAAWTRHVVVQTPTHQAKL
uniref:AB hydrolase-1 domain-containing protein n=1 Tax=Globisporangium ultimum (strain ATCC 200006 / CBS 805.95 / DAOM BR144) TaxID=431595 RepID=K3X741_GLOUD